MLYIRTNMPRFASPDAFIEKLSREQEPGEEVFNKKIVETWEEFRPRPKDFGRWYGAEAVLADSRKVSERRSEWGAKPPGSMKLEYMVMDGIGRRDWLGDTTEVTPASEYDDVFNGTDMIVRFDREDSAPLFLGIDVTATARADKLSEKLSRSLTRLQRGDSEVVKYIPPAPEGPTPDQLPLKLPRVVLGTDLAGTEQLYTSYVRALNEYGVMAGVNEHPVQMELLRQIKRQLMLGTEAATRALYREQTKNTTMDKKDLTLLGRELSLIRPLELDQLESGEWDNFVSLLQQQRTILQTTQPELAKNIFMHSDLAIEIQRIMQEKSSQGIESEEAHSGTEQLLEVPHKAAVIDFRDFRPLRAGL